MTTFWQDKLRQPVHDSYKDRIAIIAAQVEIASQVGAMAPISLTDMAGLANRDTIIKSLYTDLKTIGFSGRFLLLTRAQYDKTHKSNYPSQVPIGVPINLGAQVDTFFAFYLPPPISRLSMEQTQEKLDSVTKELIREKNRSLPFKGRILAVSPEMLAYWQTQGMWPLHEEVLDPRNAQFALGNKTEAQEIFESGNTFMRDEYLPSLLEAIEIMTEHDLIPAQLIGSTSEKPNGIFLENGFFHIYFSALTSTNHTLAQRTWVAQRDIHCHFPIAGHFDGQNSRFTVQELISLFSLRNIRRENDPKKEIMGADSATFVEDGTQTLDCAEHFCATHLMGRYTEIKYPTKLLSTESGSFELHHIVPRGVAYISLLTAILKGDLKGNESPEEMMFYLRAARVRDLVFNESKQYFEDKAKVYQTLALYLNNIDQAVNSPYNMICLCKNCHHLIHPDMRYAKNIAVFIEKINTKEIVFNPNMKQQYIGQILDRKPLSKISLSHNQVMKNLRQARRLVGLLGKPYYLTKICNYDATDELLDFARIQTTAELTQQKEFIIDTILNTYENSKSQEERHQAWRMTQLLEHHSTLEILRLSKLPQELIADHLAYGDDQLLIATANFLRKCGVNDFYVQRRNEEKLKHFENWIKH